jgi:membrane-bound lytic murein transglycosylase B
VDGNGDGKIDLFNLDDAVFSIANYLKSNGWTKNYNDKRVALHHYNNSEQYVNAILILATRVR